MVRKFSARVVCAIDCSSDQRVMVGGGIAPAAVERQLSLDISQHAARADPEQVRFQPTRAKLLFHECQPLERLPCGADPSGRLEPNGHPSALGILFFFKQKTAYEITR